MREYPAERRYERSTSLSFGRRATLR
ncbi:hypothetical protein Q604_UNBC02293G0001, partial [human gut metagenome]